MKALHPYITFSGNCAEAMTFYRDCLGGELTLQKVSEAPIAAQMPPQMQEQVMHSMLMIGDLCLMASDMKPSWRTVGNSVSVMLHCSSEEELRKTFDALAEGGTVRDPVKAQFWGGMFGALSDKFGIDWSLHYDLPQE
jgi:PhnB protein